MTREDLEYDNDRLRQENVRLQWRIEELERENSALQDELDAQRGDDQ